jgi:excinuclease ABC subunit C
MENYHNSGVDVIKTYLATMPSSPGVYRMLDSNQKVLYIGKAKNLYKRVTNYTQLNRVTSRIRTMVSFTISMEIITTETEAEALLLEASLIKSLKPRYNILLRDDKSFPYIVLHDDHEFNRISKHRGSKNIQGKYFGPFASAKDVNETLSLLQKIFQLRSCSDNYFETRKRPCMLYQIKRCSAPCVAKISKEEYNIQLAQARDFLCGKTSSIQHNLSKLMEDSSSNYEYEQAAIYRDRIQMLTSIQSRQSFTDINIQDADFIGLHRELGDCCIQIFFFRGGKNYGNKPYYPIHTEDSSNEDIMAAFIGQFYQGNHPPKNIIINHNIENQPAIEQALGLINNEKIKIIIPKAGSKLQMLNIVVDNAKEALKARINTITKQQKILIAVQNLFELPAIPKRIEVYDNSHIAGKHAVGAMIVCGVNGFDKSSYRRFNMDKFIKDQPNGGDDYAMLKEMLTRRFTRLKQDFPIYMEEIWPDFLLIDGGPGQLSVTAKVLKELDLNIPFASIAKGAERNAGKEYFHQVSKPPFTLPNDDVVMRYLQIIRDEAHRFAIGSHRIRRSNALTSSALDHISGVGKKRKKAILNHFGSVKALSEAKLEDIMNIESINKNTALSIYNYLHNNK